ncbi:MAG: MBL fold metallo-hydrolase [Roseovarius sp.]
MKDAESVTLLGVKGGPAIYPGSAMPTSILIRMAGLAVLVDTGLGATAALCRAGLRLTEIDAIFITHLHSDHYLELGPLLHTAWCAGLKRAVPVYGPSGLEPCWQHFRASMAYDIATRMEDEGRPDFAGMAALHLLDETLSLDLGGLKVRAMQNHHPPVTESHALRFESAQHSVVISGDTAPMAEMERFAKGADLLVHEAMLSRNVRALCDHMGYPDDRLERHILRSHTEAREAGAIATRAGVKALALTHFVPSGQFGADAATWRAEAQATFAGPLHIGEDGMEIPLGEGGWAKPLPSTPAKG